MTQKNRPSSFNPGRPRGVDGELWQIIAQLVERVNFLVQGQYDIMQRPSGASVVTEVAKLKVAISAVEDALTQGTAFAGAGSLQPISGDVTLAATGAGITITGSAGSGVITITGPSTLRAALGLGGLALLNPATTVTPVAGTASAAYDAATQTLINDLKAAVNSIISNLETAGIFV